MMNFILFSHLRPNSWSCWSFRIPSHVEIKGFQAPRLRAEYLPVKSADEAIAMSTDNEAGCQSVSTPLVTLGASLRHFSNWFGELVADR